MSDGLVRRWGAAVLALLAAATSAALAVPAEADPGVAVQVAAGADHSCAVLIDGSVHCWGKNEAGQLGYGNTQNIGDDETPEAAGAVDLGGHRAVQVVVGGKHTCAILDDGSVRCWGLGASGQLGYGNTENIGDDETPAAVGPVNLGPGRTAIGIAAGDEHTCVILDDDNFLRCWGRGADGELGNGGTTNIGDDETPDSIPPFQVGGPAVTIAAGAFHTCVILETPFVRCWGDGADGRLGYGDTENVGDDEEPDARPIVDFGETLTAKAIALGEKHTCVVTSEDTVRCWGDGAQGALGYGNVNDIGDNEKPSAAGDVDLGVDGEAERLTATAISAGGGTTCAMLEGGPLRCWGLNTFGQLGYGSTATIGDDETPAGSGPVNLGGGVPALVSVGAGHVCSLLTDTTVRCWGLGAQGRLGYGNQVTVGDDETPAVLGPVQLQTPRRPPGPAPTPAPAPTASVTPTGLPAPVAGKSVNVEPVKGSVEVRCPGDPAYAPLAAAESIPLGCLVDTRHGTVQLTSSKGPGAGTQTGQFWAGIFRITQVLKPRVEIVLTLSGPLECGGASSLRGRGGSSGRRLWGSGEGNFKTVGQHGSAGVRGTIWLVEDRCDDSTLFRVRRGTVFVRDFEKDANVTLHKGDSYVAKAHRIGLGR